MDMISTTNEAEVQIIRQETCPNISNTGSIIYEIGSSGDCEFIRLVKSNNGGLCSGIWISMQDIQKLLPNITSKTLKPLYGEKSSSNNPTFLKAALANEQLCTVSTPVNPSASSPKAPPQKKSAKKDTAKIQ